MIRREWEGDFVLFTQPEHARISGVLAEHWGSGDFVRPEPWDEVRLAAFEHDNGWREWEEAPTINADGLPTHFTDPPPKQNFQIFRKGVDRLYEEGHPYAAALVSRHAANVFSGILRGWVRSVSPEKEGELKPFVAEQERRQAEICKEMNERAGSGEAVSLESVSRNGGFVTALDTISLVLCNGWTHRNRLHQVPVGPAEEDGRVDIALNLVDPFLLQITPWPFSSDSLEVTAHGRRIPQAPFDTEEDLHAALKEAPPFEMTFRLTPG